MARKKTGTTSQNKVNNDAPAAPSIDENDNPLTETNLDDVLADIEDQTPTPNVDAIETARAALSNASEETNNAPPNNPPIGDLVDVDGVAFDPAKHAVKPDGTPSMTSTGRFRRKRGQGTRSRIAAPNRSASTAAPDNATPQLTEEQKQQARNAGIAAAEILFRTAVMFGGDDWHPIKNDEKQIDERRDMQNAFAFYCEQKGVTDFPPGVLLAITISSYALPRFTMPETQKRTGKFVSWIRNCAYKFVVWRKNRAARSNSRNDRKREDNTSKTDSSSAKE